MNRIFEICSVLVFPAVASLASAQIPPPPTTLAPGITISVHDYAGVPSELLSAAEEQAGEIYRSAGLETVWLNCSPKLEKIEPESCRFSDSTHLTLKISPRAFHTKVRDRVDVLGSAYPDDRGAGYFAYVYYDRVQELAERQRLGHRLLANVMAHEIGHLMLGSNSHSLSGIMCAHWNYDQLRNIGEGATSFIPSQSKIMRNRLSVRQSERLNLAPVPPEKLHMHLSAWPEAQPLLERWRRKPGSPQHRFIDEWELRSLPKVPPPGRAISPR
jgi:hypothetical protein